jgi:dolichyl-phosphate-mannose--protein O-mannosyl transferase
MLLLLTSLSLSYDEFKGDKSQLSIGYYTMLKLQDPKTRLFLSSVEFSYQKGSNQQMVRAITKGTLAETYWTTFPLPNQTDIAQGRPIECGTAIRLQHAVTGRWLHSHAIPGHFGAGHEVSCFDGSDSGDLWIIQCDDLWNAGATVRIKHVDTGMWLAANATSTHPKEFGGEFEAFASEADDNEWAIGGGIFVEENE